MNRSLLTRALSVTLALALSGAPELLAQSKALPDAPSVTRLLAQNAAPTNPQNPATQDPAQAEQSEQPQPATPRVVPVKPEPAPGTEEITAPDAATQEPQQSSSKDQQLDQGPRVIPPANPAELQKLESQQQQNEPAQAPVNQGTNPLGTAAAEKGQTAGGGASRPAGVAIAPAKQKKSKSLLIKLGAVAAAGAALGTVYALSRGTSSTPQGAR
jgi:hypothetical protein